MPSNESYYAVIFTAIPSGYTEGYETMAMRMVELASQSPGFLGIESAEGTECEITVSYWESEEAIANWKANLEHREAQRAGREKWYSSYRIRIAKVGRDYQWSA